MADARPDPIARVELMRTVRPVATRDLNALLDIAENLGPGMTTLPASRPVLAAKIEASVASFARAVPRAEAHYLLVLEDDESGVVLGTAGLYPHVGSPYGFFSYKRLRLVQRSQALAVHCDVETLSLANDYTGTTEVGTLAVRTSAKGSGAGRLLARSRYMLAAAFPDLFAPLFMGEMRGWQDADGQSPFWNAVGARFFNMDFATADKMSASRGSDFIAELLPKHPIYVDLLSEEARNVIGKPHRDSAAAMALLRSEGFRFEGFVDVFDAGPQVHCERDDIATIRTNRTAEVAILSRRGIPGAPPSLVSNSSLEAFRVVSCAARSAGAQLSLDAATAAALGVEPGQQVRWSPEAQSAR